MKAKDIPLFSIVKSGNSSYVLLAIKGNMALIKSTFTGKTKWVGINRIQK